MEDNAIISLFWERSEKAIAETSRKFGGYCSAIARAILRNREESDECVNDTWLRAWESIPPHRPDPLNAFLGRITRNLALSRLEKSGAKKRGGGELPLVLEELSECVPSGERTESRFEQRALAELIDRFLSEQSEENRLLFMRRYWYLLPLKSAARECGMTESAAKMRLMRMRAQLKETLIKEGYEP